MCPQASATRPQVFASASKHSRRNRPRVSVVAFGPLLLRRVSKVQTVTGHGAGRGSVAASYRACEKGVRKVNECQQSRDAAPWISHLGNFICFWRVTSFLRVRSDRDDIPWGRHPGNCRHFWSLVSSPHVRHTHCRRQVPPQFAMLVPGPVFVACNPVVGRDTETRHPHACPGSWMLAESAGTTTLLAQLRNGMEWKGQGNVRWKGGE